LLNKQTIRHETRMQRNWSKRNVDLNQLSEKVTEFFKDDYFEVTTNETKNCHRILAKDSPNYDINGQIAVTIDGKPEEFSIKIELQKENKPKILSFPTILTTLLGGGYLLIQHSKSDEEWIEFRKNFWQQVDRIVMSLSSSANSSTQ